MIKVIRERNTIHITGHAEYDVEGKDIVCAGVSASAQLLVSILDSITSIDYHVNKGDLYLTYMRGIHPDIIVAKFMIQMEDMALQYPKYIQVGEKKNADNSVN